MDKNQNQATKCYCARCFMPIDASDKVDIEGQNYHRICSMCCICRQVPTSLKTFYGHVFCQDCFKRHVLRKIRGDSPSLQCQRWCMQWAPATQQPSHNNETKKDESSGFKKNESKKEETKDKLSRKCFCSRCLQSIEGEKVEIDGQCFHEHCAKCCRCRRVPTTSPKIYNGRVFCSECYRTLMSTNRKAGNTAGSCREWMNPEMAQMNQSMAVNTAAFFMMMQHPFRGGGPGGGAPGGPPCGAPGGPPCGASGGAPGGAPGGARSPTRAGAAARGWPTTELDKYDLRSPSGLNTALPAPPGPGGDDVGHPPAAPAAPAAAGDFALDTLTGAADPHMNYSVIDGSAIDVTVEKNEKIEKLTKLLRTNGSQFSKKWKNFDMEEFQDPTSYGWFDIQDRIKNKSKVEMQQRPRSLWQCGLLSYYCVNKACDDKPSLSKDVMCHFIRSVWK